MENKEDNDMEETLQVTISTIGGSEAKLDLKGSHSLENVQELAKEALGIAADNEVVLTQNEKELPSVGLAHDEISKDAHLFVVKRTFPVALLFPGESPNHAGILLMGVHEFPDGKHMLEQVKSILGYDLFNLPGAVRTKTMFRQLAMYVAELAGAKQLQRDKPSLVAACQAVGGFSLGCYAALTIAGVFDFETGLELVRVRGEGMEKAAALRDQATMEVDGPERDVLQELCKECTDEHGLCQISNVLHQQGFQCGGTRDAISKLKDKVEEGAFQAKILKLVGAFQTPFMEPAKEQLMAELDRVRDKMRPPRCYVYGLGETPITPTSSVDDIVDSLGKEVTTCGEWEASVRAMIRDGVVEFVECGPGIQLKGMMKRINTTAWENTTSSSVAANWSPF